jgi:PAS domain S-box-containing protein
MDIWTMIAVLAVLTACSALVIIFIHKLRFSVPGTLYWAWGTFTIACSLILLALRGILSDFITIVVANTAMAYGVSLVLIGIRIFVERNSRLMFNLIFPLVLVPFLFWYSHADPSVAARIVLVSLILGAFLGAIAYELLRETKGGNKQAQRFLGYVFAANAASYLIRIILTLIYLPTGDFFKSGPVTIGLYLWSIIFVLLFTAGIIMMISEKLQAQKKLGEDALRDSEHKLNHHLQNTPIGALSWDLNFKAIEWNPAAETIFGYSKAQAMGKHAAELILPENMKELVDGIFQDLISEKGGIRSTNENITKDGQQIICDWYNTTLKDFKGNVIGVASLVQDITERVQTFEALKEQKEFNEKIVQTSSAIIVGLDKNHKIKLFNKGAEKITAFKANELIGTDWFEIFFKPDIYDEMDKIWKRAWGAEFDSYVNPIQIKNGDEKVISWQSTGMYDSADETKHMLFSIGENITERVQAEKALKESEEKYRSMMESMRDPSYICSPEQNIEYMNPAMIDRVGRDASGELCYKAIYDRDEKCSWCIFDQVKKGEDLDYEVVDSKTKRYYSVSNSPIFYADATPSKLTIFHDITQQKLNQEALKKTAEQLRVLALRQTHIEEAEKKKLALELHDRVGQNLTGLNINLTIIENLLPSDSPDKISNRLSDSMALTDKIFKHIRDVMADLRPETLDDYGLVAALGLYCKKFETRYNIKTQIKGSEFTPRIELEKETALFRIVQEAMNNTAKYAKADLITLVFESSEKYDRLTIADNGIGFDPDKLNLANKNHGWGLTIMHERAIAMGMMFHIESGKGKETKVIVDIEK